ncbi:DNA-processing protein DprA [Crossiella sp. CA-258035]|uniref:DNA-processing protein DprA n=1 Tax=Crossiella sp. CA-258035 TaxID=2981138 RepID=UPI0024BC55CE|nr:DNA-processing protein DprA [Crossiella sp. CA-258035]WHT20202.1 DNA-processing protein DprA [Crossiella sp. CA-258035]
MTTTEDVRARLFLLRATDPPACAVRTYVAAHGPATAVEHIREGSAPRAVLTEIAQPDAQIGHDLRALDTGTARLLAPGDAQWPTARLAALSRHGLGEPLGLWVRGPASLAELTARAVTITGSRAPTPRGTYVTADLAHDLARTGVTIVSGAALGIDELAHRSGLAAHGAVVAVLACGIDQVHPHQHAALFADIVEAGGLLVSEYPVGARPTRLRAHARCRLLAALSAATVITEARRRGGALATAAAAYLLKRPLYAVPGPSGPGSAAAANALLRAGYALPITTAEDITHLQERR